MTLNHILQYNSHQTLHLAPGTDFFLLYLFPLPVEIGYRIGQNKSDVFLLQHFIMTHTSIMSVFLLLVKSGTVCAADTEGIHARM